MIARLYVGLPSNQSAYGSQNKFSRKKEEEIEILKNEKGIHTCQNA
jgi:hypothetical protein